MIVPVKRFFNDCSRYYKYAIYAAKSQLKSEVATSYLSWLWWILDPLLFMLVYTFVSLIVFGRGEQYFSAFIFIGYTTYKFFQSTLNSSVRLVSTNKAIVKNIYIPKHILLMIEMLVNGFGAIISFLLVFAAMAIYRVPLTLHVFQFIPLVLLLVAVTFALSTFLMHMGVFVEDLANIVRVLLRLVFYMSGVFYSISKRITEPSLRLLLLKVNPIAFIIDQMREALLYGGSLDWQTYLIWLVAALVLSALGVRVIYKNENGYVKVI